MTRRHWPKPLEQGDKLRLYRSGEHILTYEIVILGGAFNEWHTEWVKIKEVGHLCPECRRPVYLHDVGMGVNMWTCDHCILGWPEDYEFRRGPLP